MPASTTVTTARAPASARRHRLVGVRSLRLTSPLRPAYESSQRYCNPRPLPGSGRVVQEDRGVQRRALQTRGRLRDPGDPDRGRGIAGRYVIGRSGTRFPPRSPKSVQAVAGDRSATVSWQAPASSGSGGVDRYRVTSRPGSRHCTTTGPTTCTVRGLANGTRYTFTVAAQVAAGWSEPSSPSPPVVPGVPVDGHLLYPGADLAGADLSGADLQHVDIEGADLKGANLSGANLADADLLDVDLSGSTLTRAMLSGADLTYANLYDSNLSGADLENADLNGATMTGVTSGSISTVPARAPLRIPRRRRVPGGAGRRPGRRRSGRGGPGRRRPGRCRPHRRHPHRR